MVKELVVISGKGGTGKTSITASFAVLAADMIIADCDVDAPDLHVVLAPEVLERHEFMAGKTLVKDDSQCLGCGRCRNVCRFDAVTPQLDIDLLHCEGCGACSAVCPGRALTLQPKRAGEWFVSGTRAGRLIHARLGVAEENSGKLVSTLRDKARKLAVQDGCPLVLIDGPPGIGCPVIASITGVNLALVVIEPTASGLHDLGRVLGLAGHFRVPVTVCINKYDIDENKSEEIETFCREKGISLAGRIPYARAFTEAQVRGMSVVEYADKQLREYIRAVWNNVVRRLEDGNSGE